MSSKHKRLHLVVIAIVIVAAALAILLLLLPTVYVQVYCQVYNPCFVPPTANYYDGILQLYQHKPGGAIWSLEKEHNLAVCPYNSNCQVVSVGGGWYKDEGQQNNIRNEVPADQSYQRPGNHLNTYDQSVWRHYGYMESPKDWKNVEVSALFYLPTGTGEDPASYGPPAIDYVVRGSVNEDNYPQTCLAQNYHVGYMFTGADQGAKIERDIEHTTGYNAGQLTGDKLTDRPIPIVGTGKVFGFKVVVYNNVANTAVHIDAYLDTTGTGSHWNLIYSYIDDGHDSRIDSVRGQTHCPGLRPDLPISFGGPYVGLRINWSNAYFRQFTIQEIESPKW